MHLTQLTTTILYMFDIFNILSVLCIYNKLISASNRVIDIILVQRRLTGVIIIENSDINSLTVPTAPMIDSTCAL